LLDYGQAGVLVDINSPEMIANGMLGLVKDKKLYSEMAQIAHQRALDYFTMDKVVERYLEVYDEVVDSHRLTINSQ
jgi:glycosyltransferase involved in cell wall biosynthesis